MGKYLFVNFSVCDSISICFSAFINEDIENEATVGNWMSLQEVRVRVFWVLTLSIAGTQTRDIGSTR